MKNRTMRVAALLLTLTLMTSCFVGGTFAKYTTADTGTDTARVAKWGVEIAISGSTFGNNYKTHDNSIYGGDVSVQSSEKVVAPGTSSADLEGDVTFKISGTPEVATKVNIAFKMLHNVFLGAGTYEDPRTAKTDSFEITEDYYPIVFTLKNSSGTVNITGNLSKIEEGFNNLSGTYSPGTQLDETYTLTWEWAFNGNDAADTMLGNLAANDGYGINEVTNYSTTIEYNLIITVEQID